MGAKPARPYSRPMDDLAGRAKSYLDTRHGERVTLGELAGALGASPFHVQRRFKQAFGVSPRHYQEAHRMQAVKHSLRKGRRVTDALFEAGYGSVSRFYENPALGMKASDYRARGKGQRIRFACFETPLGVALVATTDRGVCAVKLGRDAAELERQLGEEFAAAELSREPLRELQEKVRASIAGEASLARVPLDIRGTVFQCRVW